MFSRERVLEATKGSFGIVSKIAKNLDGCGWITARRYIDHWEETRAAYADENERGLDLSESKMLEQIGAGDGPMIRFHLATKGKGRGYSPRVETEQRVVVEWVYGNDETARDVAGATREAKSDYQ